jgi:hypothetical protein
LTISAPRTLKDVKKNIRHWPLSTRQRLIAG